MSNENKPLLLEQPATPTRKHVVDVRTHVSPKFPPQKEKNILLSILFVCLVIIFLPIILLVVVLFLVLWLLYTISCIGPILHCCMQPKYQVDEHQHMEMINVGGYSLAVWYSATIINKDAEAAKKPVLLFVGGLGSPMGSLFSCIERKFSTYRIVVVERANYDWSDNVPTTHEWYKRDMRNSAAEIHAAICKSKVAKERIILVGGSQGGLIAQMYYYMFPQQVVGYVGIDPSTEDFFTRAVPIVQLGLRSSWLVYRIMVLCSYTGITNVFVDLLGIMPSEMKHIFEELGATEKETHDVFCKFVSTRNLSAMAQEFDSFEVGCEQVRAMRKLHPHMDVPVVVLTGLNWQEYDASYTPIWQQAQHDNIASQSEDAVQVLLPNNTHGQTCLGEYDLVHTLIDEMVSKIK